MILDKMTDNADDCNMSVTDIVGALGFARKFEFATISAIFRQALLDEGSCRDAPIILAYAYQMQPFDLPLARHALSHFTDLMPMNHAVYRQAVSNRKKGYASPSLHNLKPPFLESLGVMGALAYTETLHQCRQSSECHWRCWDWTRVPETFVSYLDWLSRESPVFP